MTTFELEQLRPEAAYFCPDDGKRTPFIVFDMEDSSQLAVLTEPMFGEFRVTIEIFAVMNRGDLKGSFSTGRLKP